MSKGKFRNLIKIRLYELGVLYGDTSFVVRIKAHGRFGVEGIIPISYFGYIQGGVFYVESYSFSVQGLPKETQEAYNVNPLHTALMGLEAATGKSLWRWGMK